MGVDKCMQAISPSVEEALEDFHKAYTQYQEELKQKGKVLNSQILKSVSDSWNALVAARIKENNHLYRD